MPWGLSRRVRFEVVSRGYQVADPFLDVGTAPSPPPGSVPHRDEPERGNSPDRTRRHSVARLMGISVRTWGVRRISGFISFLPSVVGTLADRTHLAASHITNNVLHTVYATGWV